MSEDVLRIPHRFAIVGGGCAGTLVAAQLLLQAPEGAHIILIERSPPVGRGVAYGTEFPEHVLNVPADRMSALPDDPEHFLRWARSMACRLGFPSAVSQDDFLPRWMYGRYLHHVLEEARGRRGPGVSFENVVGEAVDLEESETGPRITLADGRTLEADEVVLALGILPGEYPIRRPLPFYRTSRYVHSPFLPDVLGDVSKGDNLLIVGAGLTAVDIAVQCHRLGHSGVIHALSRRGIRPLAHLPAAGNHPQFLLPDALPGMVKETLRLVRAEARSGDWRAVVDSMRPVSQLLWQGYSLEDRSRFMRHLRPFWEAHRHRIAPATAEIISKMEASGHLKFHAGRLVSLRSNSDGAAALIRLRGKEDFLPLRVAKVINCTGPRTDYSKYQHPLLINLLASGLIGHDPLALGIDALPTGEVLRYGGIPTGWLFTIGAPLKGVLWESTAVAEIRIQALNIAKRLISRAVLAVPALAPSRPPYSHSFSPPKAMEA
jgi:uncharacterized NAD(P)/FAD-binding protein YdhS